MGNPAYDARREAERADAEKEKASAESATAAWEAFTALMTGRAYVRISNGINGGTFISIERR